MKSPQGRFDDGRGKRLLELHPTRTFRGNRHSHIPSHILHSKLSRRIYPDLVDRSRDTLRHLQVTHNRPGAILDSEIHGLQKEDWLFKFKICNLADPTIGHKFREDGQQNITVRQIFDNLSKGILLIEHWNNEQIAVFISH